MLYKIKGVRIDGPFRTVDELELATLSWVHWSNEYRLHSVIGYRTPAEAERSYYAQTSSEQQLLIGELALCQTRGDPQPFSRPAGIGQAQGDRHESRECNPRHTN